MQLFASPIGSKDKAVTIKPGRGGGLSMVKNKVTNRVNNRVHNGINRVNNRINRVNNRVYR